MAATDLEERRQVKAAFAFGQLVEGHDQGGVAEEVGRLRHLVGELPFEPRQVVVRQFEDGHREHAALELEYGVLIEEVGLAHGACRSLNCRDL